MSKLLSISLALALLNAAIAILSFTLTSFPTFANTSQPSSSQSQRIRWTPNRKMGSAQRTLSGGRRGQAIAHCNASQAKSTPLTLLVPQANQSVLTIEENPTFFWHTETDRPTTAQFILSDPNTAEPVFTQTIRIDRAGISRITPPTKLKTGTRYRWTVLLACNDGTSKELIARSFVERIENAELYRKTRALSDLDRAVTFAQQGIWFDTLTTLIDAAQKNPRNPQVKAELRSLLSEIGRPSIEIAQVLKAIFGS